MMTATGELVLVGIPIVGAVVVVNWLLVGFGVSTRPVRREARPQPRVSHCWYDRRYGGEIGERPLPPVRRFYAREGI